MTSPSAIHAPSRNQVATPRPSMREPQVRMPSTGTTGTNGVRKGRGSSGRR
ncbi:MAG TPA: hypothetical protein VEU33_09555 [Archangium sp.]|nr:hypothetical protein [Archangium sp.]